MAVEDFWQNFPNARRRCSDALEVGLFPRESRTPVELQGGEQKRHMRHALRGFSFTTVSTIDSGAGSVGDSARPTLPSTTSTSGIDASS